MAKSAERSGLKIRRPARAVGVPVPLRAPEEWKRVMLMAGSDSRRLFSLGGAILVAVPFDRENPLPIVAGTGGLFNGCLRSRLPRFVLLPTSLCAGDK